jgi:hypothetical protein
MSNAAARQHAPEMAVQTLACNVIKQALLDALDPMAPLDVQRDAREFLAGDQWYRRWCVAAGLRPVRMLTRWHAA